MRKGYQQFIEDNIRVVEACKEHSNTCGCDVRLDDISAMLGNIETQNKSIQEHFDREQNEEEIKKAATYSKTVHKKVDRLRTIIREASYAYMKMQQKPQQVFRTNSF